MENESKQHSDSVWQRFLAGDKEAFARIYNQHIDTLFRYGTKLCAAEELVKDAIQEVFIDLYLKRETNKTNPENLRFYLLLALKRNLIRKLKKERQLVAGEIRESLFHDSEFSAEYQMIEQEQSDEKDRVVVKALAQLSAKQKETIYLRFNEAMEYEEIASILEISVESVRKQVYRAIKTIRELVAGEQITLFFAFLPKFV